MTYSIEIVECAPRVLAAARVPMPRPGGVPKVLIELLDSVYAFLKANPVVRQTGHNVAVYWSPPGWMQAGVEIASPFESDDGAVTCSATPSGRAAMTVHRGSPAQIGAANSAIGQFLKEHGLAHAGPSWEIYGDWTEDEAQFETEVYYLIS